MRRFSVDSISAPPTIDMARGRAWCIDLDQRFDILGRSAMDCAEVAVWLVEAPWAHPIWHSYIISLIQLRPMDGLPEPMIYLDGATHEMCLFAMDPMANRDAIISHGARLQLLEPANFAAQFIEPSDESAAARIKESVRLICGGLLSPDSDYARSWADQYGANMLRD